MKGLTIDFARQAAKELAEEAIKKLTEIYGDKIQVFRRDDFNNKKGLVTSNHWFVGIKGDRHSDDKGPNPKAWSIQIIPDVSLPETTSSHDEWFPSCIIYYADPKFPRTVERLTVRGIVNQSCKALSDRLHQVEQLYG